MKSFVLPDGRALQYDLRGPADDARPVIVFSNGLSQTTVAWGLQAQRLQRERRLLLWDASGQGRSDPPPGVHRPPAHAADLLALLDGLGIGTVDLVGFSFGARIALRTVLAAPDRVRRVVLVGCAHRETTLRRWIVKGWLDALDVGGLEHCFQIVTPMVVGEAWLAKNEHNRDAMLRAFVRRNDHAGLRHLMADSTLPGGDIDATDLARITHPVLVVRGEDDLVVPRWINEELAAALPDASYAECPGVGHSVAIEDADWFTARLVEFLEA